MPIIRNFVNNTSGSVFIIVALSAMAVLGATGVAVDIGRSQMVQAKLQNAVDAAGLAAGATINSADLTEVATKYILLNFNHGNLNATLHPVVATLSADKKILTVTAAADVPTTIMKLLGHSTVTIDATTEVTRSNKGLELALVLDTTGSMSGTKIFALKTASHDLVDILFGDTTTQENLWIGVVPFSQAVNVGSSHTNWLNASHYAGLNWGTTSWSGCLDERYSTGRDVTDDPPFDLAAPAAAVPAAPYERFRAYYWPDHDTYNNWITSGPTYKITGSKGPNTYCPSVLTPLSNTKTTINAGIDALVANGNTHIGVGAVWGWRLISPRWRGYWGGSMDSNNLPLDYNTPLMSKAVVIMTDGTNTISNSVRGAYGYLSNGNLGTTSSSAATTQLNNRLSSVCTAMKTQGITVYTILFEESSATITTLMRNCASNPDYFFNSPTEEALKTAFQTIGDSLASLRISH